MAGDNFSLSSTVPWFVHVLWLYIAISYVGCLSILEHLVDPLVAPNCSTVTLTCRVDAGAAVADVWWTYRGENASKLPDVTMITDEAENGEWKLELKCPTLEHRGSYACNVQGRNESEVVYRKEAAVKIYVPVTIEVGYNMSSEEAGGKVNLTCRVTAHPLATVKWLKDGDPVNATDGKLQSTTHDLDGVTVLASLLVSDLEREDNGTYICQASNEFSNSSATQDIIVQEAPVVQFLNETETGEDPSTTTLKWRVLFDGNLPLLRFILRRENSVDSEKTMVDENIPPNVTYFTVNGLLPGLTYNFELSAVNKAGNSEWDSINVSVPAGVPPKVSWIHVLASTNETLLFGWRRPAHDNGANITHYNVHLWHNGSLVENKTMDIQAPGRNNLMFIFATLQSGEMYNFQVQACNSLGCGNWSEPLDGTTSDGIPDPPRNVEVKCEHDYDKDIDNILVTWDVPLNARGTISHYNITIFRRARFRNDNGQYVEEKITNIELVDVKSNKLEFLTEIVPNTEYTVQMCTVNRAGCGPMTNVSANTRCMSLTNVPSILPDFQMQRMNNTNDCRQLKLKLQRVSERNGSILCYRVIMIKLQKGQNLSKLPADPQNLNLSTHEKVHKNDGYGAYVAEAFKSEEFVSEVVIGDNQQRYCESISSSDRKRHIVSQIPSNREIQDSDIVHDGSLSPSTNYTGFVEIRVQGPNDTVLTKTSPYFSPILTGSPPTPTPKESHVAVILGVICGIILVIVAIVLALFLIR